MNANIESKSIIKATDESSGLIRSACTAGYAAGHLRILDLYCKAGGVAMGLHRAFPKAEIVGIDIEQQRNYPFEFIQADALEYPLQGFDFIWASPPCQHHSAMTKRWGKNIVASHPDLIEPTRKRLENSGTLWTIENVMGAPLRNPIMLCGTMFGLQTKYGNQLRRHRIFEMPWYNGFAPVCNHNNGSAIGVYGGGQHPQRRRPATIGVWGNAGGSSKRDGLLQFGTQDRRDAMGIDWMTGKELSQAIPPAFSQWIAERLIEHKNSIGLTA